MSITSVKSKGHIMWSDNILKLHRIGDITNGKCCIPYDRVVKLQSVQLNAEQSTQHAAATASELPGNELVTT
jgi:hypothetical protein